MTRSRIVSPRTWAALALFIYTLAHLLASAGLVAFGVSAGGYPLNR